MSLFRSTSESSHPSETEESFSEAFLDSSSRTRDALPEQYRTQFDELKSGILAFCHEFDIPVSTLSNKEAFGVQLASKKIPQERMQEAVSLFEHLEHLIVHKEPLKEKSPEYLEEAEHLYNLTEQYHHQVSLLERAGILKDGAITGIDGENYPIPTLEQIAERFYEQREKLETKRDQGFTKLLLVPFGMSLDTLRETLKQFLLSYKKDHSDFDLNIKDHPVSLRSDQHGLDQGNSPKLVYYPKSFDEGHHQGQTKLHILEKQAVTPGSFPGWTVHLLQPSNPADSESRGFSTQTQRRFYGRKIPRPTIEVSKSSDRYLLMIQEAQDNPTSPYHGESGLTPEDWILAFIIHLEEKKEFLDVYEGAKPRPLLGSFLPTSVRIPSLFWLCQTKDVNLDDIGTVYKNAYNNIHTSVII